MFIFCCYTGVGYTEMANLNKSNLQQEVDGNVWIKVYRQKTNRNYEIPLLSKAKSILDKYTTENKLLPIISNQRFNSYLKEIAEIIGITKNLTHHMGRKTFASTVLLYNDVPMEIVSELLGHSEIGVTQQHYAKVVKEKIGEQMMVLNSKLQ